MKTLMQQMVWLMRMTRFLGILVAFVPAAAMSAGYEVDFCRALSGTDSRVDVKYRNSPIEHPVDFRDPMPGRPLVSQLMTRDGKLVLFRAINQRYKRNWNHNRSIINAYSYSLNPLMAISYGNRIEGQAGFEAPTVLISINNLDDVYYLKSNPEEGLWNVPTKLSPLEKVEDNLAYEVRVLYGRENVVGTVSLNDFKTVISSLDAEFSLRTLFERLAPFIRNSSDGRKN